MEVRVVPEDNNMNTNTDLQADTSLSALFEEVLERDPHADILAKYSRMSPKKKVIPHTSKTYESLLNTYTRTVERSCARLGVSDQDGCLFAVTITPHKSWLMQPTNGLYDDDKKTMAGQEIAKYIQNECNYFLWNKPNKHTDKFIQGVNVIETRDRSGNKISHHQHGLWLVHPTVAPRFYDQLISNLLGRKHINFNNRSYKLNEVIDSIEITPITNDGDPDHSTHGWLSYIFKNDEDQKLLGKWFTWDNGWSESS